MTARTLPCGAKVLFVDSTASTNSDLMRMASDDTGLEDGLVLCAAVQTAGKGRQGRRWVSNRGDGLFFSVLVKPRVSLSEASTLPLVAGAAVATAVEGLCPGVEVLIKWPNDIHVRGRKLCGILCEMKAIGGEVRHIVVGIGLNLSSDSFPDEIAAIATSLKAETGRAFGREEVLDAILSRLRALRDVWETRGFGAVLPEIARRDALLGRNVSIECGGPPVSGTACGIAEDGALMLSLADGFVERVYSGDAHVARRGP